MTARIGRVYSRNAERTDGNRAADRHFFGDRRMLFVDRRARLRRELGTAALVLAWAAAVVALVLTFANVL